MSRSDVDPRKERALGTGVVSAQMGSMGLGPDPGGEAGISRREKGGGQPPSVEPA